MLKFFRKYNKIFLVVFGVFLMIAFLAPGAIERLFINRRGYVVATLDGRKIYSEDHARARAEFDVARDFLQPYQMIVNLDPEDTSHWMLLAHEAEQGGFVSAGSQSDIDDLMSQVAPQFALVSLAGMISRQNEGISQQDALYGAQEVWQNPAGAARYGIEDFSREEIFNQALGNAAETYRGQLRSARMTEEEIRQAFAKVRGVQRLIEGYVSLATLSDRRTRIKTRQLLDEIETEFVPLPADVILDQVPEPTEAQLQEHYEKYREVEPGEGEHGFGYMQPDRVKLEYIRIDTSTIREAINPDAVELRKHYNANRDRFPGEFGEVQERVRRDLVGAELERVRAAIESAYGSARYRILQTLEGEDRYKKLPPNWESVRPPMEEIAGAIVEQVLVTTGVRIPAPTVVRLNDSWLTPQDVARLEGFGLARINTGLPVTAALFQLRELGNEGDTDLQIGLPASSAAMAGNAIYFFQITAAKKSSPPDSLEEIRDDVKTDWQRLQAYKLLESRLDEFKNLAVLGGLESVLQRVVPVAPGSEPAPDRPSVREQNVSGRDNPGKDQKPVYDAVMALAREIDPLTPAKELTPEETVFAAAMPRGLGVIVGRIKHVSPITTEVYRMVVSKAAQDLVGQEIGQHFDQESSPLSREHLAERHRWTDIRKD